MHISTHEIHIWTADLSITQEQDGFNLLSPDECARANRFHFPIHKTRFIAARSMLRKILGIYLNLAPQEIIFGYNSNQKPYLTEFDHLQFNLSHSGQMAIYAFAIGQAIGVDIEEIRNSYKPSFAKRFFSPQENHELQNLSPQDQAAGFYRIWAHKEAIIKASGKKLSTPLATISVSIHSDHQTVIMDQKQWTVLSLPIHPDYQAAIASNQAVESITYCNKFKQSSL